MSENTENEFHLTPDQEGEARKNREAIGHFLMTVADRYTRGELLYSSGGEGSAWSQTGLIVDTDSNRLCAKVGDFPYQPIGYFTDEFFVPNAANKLFWSRKFKFVTAWEEITQLPFTSRRVSLSDENLSLTDAMLAQAESVHAEIKQELDKLVAMTPEQRAEESNSVREYNKLLCLKFPPLDDFFKKNIEKNPDIALALDKADPVMLLITESEWIGAKIRDEKHKRALGGLVTTRQDLTAADQILGTLKKAIAAGRTDDDSMSKLLNGAYVIDPLLRETIDGMVMKQKKPLDIANAVINQLERRVANG